MSKPLESTYPSLARLATAFWLLDMILNSKKLGEVPYCEWASEVCKLITPADIRELRLVSTKIPAIKSSLPIQAWKLHFSYLPEVPIHVQEYAWMLAAELELNRWRTLCLNQ